MVYIKPLSAYKFDLESKKLEGLARLSSLGVPTVSDLFIVLPRLYLEFNEKGRLPTLAVEELKEVFKRIRGKDKSVALRNSIFEENNPGVVFAVHNSLNIKQFEVLRKQIISGYKKVRSVALNPDKVEFSFLIQSFYSSEKCGILLSENGQHQVFIQAILGQHTKLLLRGDIEPDVYKVDKKDFKIVYKKIVPKKYRIKKLDSGIKQVRVEEEEQQLPVLTDEQIEEIARYSQVVEKTFGPQEIEWAVLDEGKIIFQESRDFEEAEEVRLLAQAGVIFPQETAGEILNLETIPNGERIADKIVVTGNLNISFINKLAFLYRPRAVILVRGALTSHAATVLRESKITTLLLKGASFKDGERVKINKDGRIQKLI